MHGRALHFGRLAKECRHGQINARLVPQSVMEHETLLLGGIANDSDRTSLTLGYGLEGGEIRGADSKHIALLALIAPDGQGAQR